MDEEFIKKPIEDFLDKDLIELLDSRQTAIIFPEKMSKRYPSEKHATSRETRRGWELAGLKCANERRFSDAIEIFDSFYNWLLEYQEISGKHIPKGLPLVWMAEYFNRQGCRSLAKRFLMLTLIEDSIGSKANIKPETSGVYFRLVWQFGMEDSELKRYATKVYEIYKENPNEGLFPEWILQELDNDWITNIPSPNESMLYRANKKYINFLLNKLGEKTGKELEKLGEYILSQIPGFRTSRRGKTPSTDYDIICSVEGIESDFRSKLGRYFICECKDWNTPADFTTIAKFCRVLDSAKCKFGIIFSKKGITGKGITKFAEREIIKVFQDRGIAIVIIDENDLKEISKGKNFITILRNKYEKTRLDLLPSSALP